MISIELKKYFQYEAKFNFLKIFHGNFLNNISDYYSRIILLISRAGASTISETKNFILLIFWYQ